MAGLVPAIHVLLLLMYQESKTWMPGTSPGMTECVEMYAVPRISARHYQTNGTRR
jgi:hypothetical protein